MTSIAERLREEGRREVREESKSIAEQLREEGFRKGYAEGTRRVKENAARRLIEQGMSIEKVADIVDMKLPELTELLAESPSQPE